MVAAVRMPLRGGTAQAGRGAHLCRQHCCCPCSDHYHDPDHDLGPPQFWRFQKRWQKHWNSRWSGRCRLAIRLSVSQQESETELPPRSPLRANALKNRSLRHA